MKNVSRHFMLMAAGIGLCLLLIPARFARGRSQRPQQVFEQANQQLQNGKPQQALLLYRQLVGRKQVSGPLFLNMGLTYVRIDSMGQAKYYFLKAREFVSTRDRAVEGLKYVENHFSHQSAVLPVLPWQRALNWVKAKIGAVWLLAVGLILLNIGIFFLITPWFFRGGVKGLNTIAISLISMGVIAAGLSFFVNYRQHRYQQAVMVRPKTTVRQKPDRSATMVTSAYEGYTFRADLHRSKHHRKWTYIRLSNGQYGWILTNQIMIL